MLIRRGVVPPQQARDHILQ